MSRGLEPHSDAGWFTGFRVASGKKFKNLRSAEPHLQVLVGFI